MHRSAWSTSLLGLTFAAGVSAHFRLNALSADKEQVHPFFLIPIFRWTRLFIHFLHPLFISHSFQASTNGRH
jgi:hypothetical protein